MNPSFRSDIRRLDRELRRLLGPRGWWPTTRRPGAPPVYRVGREGEPVSDRAAFEIVVGAILTQNTAWGNVEKALINLSAARRLEIDAIAGAGAWLEAAIRPSGYFRQKAMRLRTVAREIRALGGIRAMRRTDTAALRETLLDWHGVGPETADSILCYAFARPVFVVDAYTRRLFAARGLPAGSYREIQELVHEALPGATARYNDFHARIVHFFSCHLKNKG